METIVQASALQRYLAANVAKFRPSTTLIISSAPPFIAANSSSNAPQKTDQPLNQFLSAVDSNIRQCQFFASMQFNLKTVPYGSSLSSAYPTQENLSSALELMKRMGATNIIGVGNGAAVDLAKACYFSSRKESSEDSELILAPSTLGAVMASTSRESLFLSTEEEALLPSQSFGDRGVVDNNDFRSNTDEYCSITTLVDPKALVIPNWINNTSSLEANRQRANVATVADATLAALAISIDTAHAMQEINDERVLDHCKILVQRCANHALSSLKYIMEENSQVGAVEKSRDDAIKAVLHAGELITFGMNSGTDCTRRRNVPLALSSALLPRYFPHSNWITFTASLTPGLVTALQKEACEKNEILHKLATEIANTLGESIRIVPPMAFFADGSPSITKMVDEIDANSIYLNSIDAKLSIFENTLISSLNR